MYQEGVPRGAIQNRQNLGNCPQGNKSRRNNKIVTLQEGVPRGAIQNRKTLGIAPRAINPGGTIKLLHYRKECPEGQYKIETPGELPPGQ